AFANGGAPACAVHTQFWKGRLKCLEPLAARALPITAVAIQRDFMAFQVLVYTPGEFIVLKPAAGRVGVDRPIRPYPPAEQGLVIAEVIAGHIAVGCELRRIHEINIDPIAEPAKFQGIGWRLEILHIAANEKRLPVLGKQIIDEEEIACAP